jgi:hypothetical protein
MNAILHRIRREPVVSRAGLAAVLNVLVVSGLIDAGGSDAVSAVVLALVNVVAVVGARARVTPVGAARR